MASPFPFRAISNQNQKNPNNTICASFLKDVCLHDWWLINVEKDSKGRRLGVGGFASRERQGIRTFNSAAIVKRHDTITLETADGITVTLSGFVNRSLTHQNGFPSDICNHFRFGFPYYWEEYASRCFSEEHTNKAVPPNIPRSDGFNMSSEEGSNNFRQVSLEDLPVTRIHDLLTSTCGTSEYYALTNNIFNDMLQKYGTDAFKHNDASARSNIGSDCPVKTGDSALDETLSNRKQTEAKQNSTGDNGFSHSTYIGEEEEFSKIRCQSKMDGLSSSTNVATRSKTRLNNLKAKHEGYLSPHTSKKREHRESTSEPKISGMQYEGTVPRRNASNMNATILSVNETEAKESPCTTTSRRSSRPNTQSNLFSRFEVPPSHANEFSRKEIEVEEFPCKSAVRRSNRLRNLNK